jgi:dihydrolipoamide dehydrogenase
MASRVVVIGAGPGGYVAAIRAAQLGAEVTLIERERVGGTCLNWGCIPSKVLRTSAELLDRVRRGREYGLALEGGISLDLGALMARKEKVIGTQARGIMDILKHHRIRYTQGIGTIAGPGRIKVRGHDREASEIPWEHLILALGSAPLDIPGLPVDGRRILSSNDALEVQAVPESLLIVGGGVIGCEFAFIFSAFGSQVTLVEAKSRLIPLPSVDEDCSRVIQREMAKRRISVVLESTVERVEDKGEGFQVFLGPSPFVESPSEKVRRPASLEVEKVLLCIGRKPDTVAVGLERIGVKVDNNGWVLADETMKTSAPRVYAIGDVLGPSKVMLAHVASREGMVAAENAAGGTASMSYEAVPNVIFTMPEISNVGLTEAQAKEQGLEVRAESVLFRNIAKPHVIGEIGGMAKIVFDVGSGRIWGVHLVGACASDLIAEGALAVKTGRTIQELAGTIHGHPTLAEIMSEVSMKALGRPVHG